MIQALPILTVGLLELWLASVVPLWFGVPLVWVGLGTVTVGVAYLLNRPRWLGKQHLLVRLWVTPYLWFARGVAWGAQALGHTERDEVVPGLWVGGWPRRGAPGLAQLDLTAELPRRGEALAYGNVPMLDGRGMSLEALDAAIAWALESREAGRPVLVHCAYGHGRSVTVACAVMVVEGLAEDLDAAQDMVRRYRPRAGIRRYQRVVVDRWLAARRAGQEAPPAGGQAPEADPDLPENAGR